MYEIIKKQKLFFISLIGIVVISMILLTTYAYQTLEVDYKGNEELNVNAGVLDVAFTSTRRINLQNMPLLNDYNTSDYTEFIIDNSKSTGDVSYKIRLVNLEYSNELISNDFKYTIVKVDKNNNLNVIGEGDFSDLVSNEYDFKFNDGNYIEIKQGNKDKIRLYLWLKESENDQNYLENTNFKGVIEINSVFSKDLDEEVFTKFNIYGNTVINYKNNTSEQSVLNPAEIKSLGTLVEDQNSIYYGKYKINIINIDGKVNSIYLNEPLRCINEVCDYIDAIKKKVVRKIGVKKLNEFEWNLENDNNLKVYANIPTDLNIKNDVMYTEITKYNPNTSDYINGVGNNTVYLDNSIGLSITDFKSLEEFNNYISSNNVSLYYQLANQDETENIIADLYSIINRNIKVNDGIIDSSNIEIK